jgi:4-hydroxythreonine-4-phosphate dehydrogenase
MGDPAGIGPEIIVKAWKALSRTGPAFLVVGDFEHLASVGGAAAGMRRISTPAEAVSTFPEALPVLDAPMRASAVAGQPSSEYGQAVIGWIETAARLAMDGAVSGLVTAPIAKAPLYGAGFAFPGHTEYLAALTHDRAHEGPRGPVMMLTAGGLRTVLATIHEPLALAPGLLTQERIVTTGLVAARALEADFGVASPRLAMAALNPHGGEGGALGREEIEVIAPASRRLRELGVDCTDPMPADTLFHEAARRTYDAAICMYHDQALIPVKMLDFWGGVNVTLGLPIVRTSPDHGVAYDIAGRGLARPDSLIAAIRLAADIAARRGLHVTPA